MVANPAFERDAAKARRPSTLRWASGVNMFRSLLLIFTIGASSTSVYAKDALHTFTILLLQPDFILQERVPDATALYRYIKGIDDSVSDAIKTVPRFPSTSGYIVVAVKPGQKSNIWLDFQPKLKPQIASAIKTAARAVPPAPVTNGVVVLAMKVGLWGGPEPISMPLSPPEWMEAAKKAGRPMEVGDLVETIWPD